jgi:hypothetical protein
VSHVRTKRALIVGRAALIDGDPAPAAEIIRNGFRVSPYVPGAQGTAVATFLAGRSPLAQEPPPTETPFVESSGLSFNTIPANDFS